MVVFFLPMGTCISVFTPLFIVALSVCTIQLTFASDLPPSESSGPQFCGAIAQQLSGVSSASIISDDITNGVIAEFLALNLNPQRYYGGCFTAPYQPIPSNATITNGAVESLNSALKAFGLRWHSKHRHSSATSLMDLYNLAKSLTTELSFTLFQWADWDALTNALANGNLAVVAFQSANEAPADGYVNVFSNTRYALVSGMDSQFMYLTDPRTAKLRSVDRRAFFFERWKSQDKGYGTSGICSRCGLLVGRGAKVLEPGFLRRRSSCPISEPLP